MDKKAYLEEIDSVIAKGPYKDTWESLSQHEIPEWYRKSKLGFFIHWGVYSVPAYFSEWYPRFMYHRQNPVYWHHKRKYGKDFNYHDFIPMFSAEKFCADEWLNLFCECNVDFIMPVAEHHDGFKMYKSDISRWNSFEMGPKRDILGELKKACEKRGVPLAASSHRAEHYWFMNGGISLKYKNATQDEKYRDFYGPCAAKDNRNGLAALLNGHKGIVPTKEWLEDWLVSSCEIVDKYLPSNSYFDFYAADEVFRPYMRKFLAYYYNRAAEHKKEVVSFYKLDAALYPCGVYVKERGQIEGVSANIWQCETSTAYNAWSYCTTNKFKNVSEIIGNMIDVWSKNGCMALNIGPKSDGTICKEEVEILKTLATWIKKNKEAIWDTTAYKAFGEGKKQKTGVFYEKYHYTKKDFRFTYCLGTLYVFALSPKGQNRFTVRSISNNGSCNSIVKRITILGEDTPVKFNQKGKYLEINTPHSIKSTLPICFKLEIE